MMNHPLQPDLAPRLGRNGSSALRQVTAFFEANVIGLSCFVDGIGRTDLEAAFKVAIADLSGPALDRDRVAASLGLLRDTLATVGNAELEKVAHRTGVRDDPQAALLWYVARLSDATAAVAAKGATPTA